MSRLWEIVIRGGLVVDGGGGPARRADVALRGGRVVRLAESIEDDAEQVFDAVDQIVAPGFIDMHSHSDLAIGAFPGAECALTQGVTSAVVGNCGLTAFPLEPGYRAELEAYLAPFVPRSARYSWAWSDLDGFYAEAAARGVGINLAPLVGQGSLRLAVRGFADGAATADERARMAALLARALDQGALGLSLGLLYPPGSYAGREELVDLAAQAGRAGGLLAVHVRNEGDQVIESVAEAIDIAEAAGARLQLSHQKAVGRANWGKVHRTLELVEDALRRGVDVALDLWPYTSGSTTITALLPEWVLEGGVAASLERLTDPTARTRMRREIESGALSGEDLLLAVGFDGILLAECPSRPELEGRSLAELIAARGALDRWEGFFDLLREIELRATMIIWEELDEQDVRQLLRSPRCCIGSDSWATAPEAGGKPHPRTYGAFPHYLRRYVLDEGLLSLEEGIRRITSLPAERAGLRHRGRLVEGAWGDVVVFDPRVVRDQATFSDPHQMSAGIRHVLVNGQLAICDGQPTGLRAGRVLSSR
jgi:N-acyl-D-amino-acid deacylase